MLDVDLEVDIDPTLCKNAQTQNASIDVLYQMHPRLENTVIY